MPPPPQTNPPPSPNPQPPTPSSETRKTAARKTTIARIPTGIRASRVQDRSLRGWMFSTTGRTTARTTDPTPSAKAPRASTPGARRSGAKGPNLSSTEIVAMRSSVCSPTLRPASRRAPWLADPSLNRNGKRWRRSEPLLIDRGVGPVSHDRSELVIDGFPKIRLLLADGEAVLFLGLDD